MVRGGYLQCLCPNVHSLAISTVFPLLFFFWLVRVQKKWEELGPLGLWVVRKDEEEGEGGRTPTRL